MRHTAETICYVVLKTAAHRLVGASSQDPRLGVPRVSIYDWACEPTLLEDLAAHPVKSTAPFCAHVGPSTPC